MPSGSVVSAGIDSKRQRALPVPKGTADMKAFTPDSSIASDVIPSPNYGERNKGRAPDMILLHYTGMPDVEGAITQLCTPGTDVSAHYIVLEDGRIVERGSRLEVLAGPRWFIPIVWTWAFLGPGPQVDTPLPILLGIAILGAGALHYVRISMLAKALEHGSEGVRGRTTRS